MIKAAGVLFMHEGRILILHRWDGAGWGLPGGGIEEGETALDAAVRECGEEIGFRPDPSSLVEFSRRVKDGVDWTTFACVCDEAPAITLNDEHLNYAWVTPDEAKAYGLHPGMAGIITKLTGHELDVAKAIRDGELASPQLFHNVWLFDIRITGTGAAYRTAVDEFVWRDKSLYLNDDFVARCNGLPVIYEHPDGKLLDSDEFNDRIVGTVVLPYIKGEDVWGVAKIYDSATVEILLNQPMSTSPGVKLRLKDAKTLNIDDIGKLLIEDGASLLDHVAICERGVWDKAGDPRGIISEGVKMDNDGGSEVVKNDAAAAPVVNLSGIEATLAAILDGQNKLNSRIDSLEAKADEAEKDDADAEKDDAECAKPDSDEEDKKAKEKADKMDADLADVRAKLDEIAGKVADRSDAEIEMMADAGKKADDAAAALSMKVNTRPMSGERGLDYRVRMAKHFQSKCAAFADSDLKAIAKADANTFSRVEERIYADAMIAADSIEAIPAGQLIERKRFGESGHQITEYIGSGPGVVRGAFADFHRPSQGASYNTSH